MMRLTHPNRLGAALAGLALAAGALPLDAQQPAARPAVARTQAMPAPARAARPRPRARPMTREQVQEAARTARGRRLIVSLDERRLWSMDNGDTLYSAPIAVGKGTELSFGGARWNFTTPFGIRRVRSKETNPVWTPPDWHYVELARDSSWTLVRLERGRPITLPDRSRLEVRGDRIGRVVAGRFEPIPADEEVIYGDTLFIPPLGTANRRVEGELGAFKLALGDGYMIHGTPHQDSIGQAATHGCIRMKDADISYIYWTVPVGTAVYIY